MGRPVGRSALRRGRAGGGGGGPGGERKTRRRGTPAGGGRLSVKSAADWFSAFGSLDIDTDRALDLRNLFELIDQSPSSRFVHIGEGAFVSLTAGFQRQLADLRVSTHSGKQRIRLHGLAALRGTRFSSR